MQNPYELDLNISYLIEQKSTNQEKFKIISHINTTHNSSLNKKRKLEDKPYNLKNLDRSNKKFR